ncbi:MAG TPA: Fe-S cluster assembly protein SufD [Candidatus Aquilonibacter sp.]|nr:Fe-S cluster assembly protein SufD [Candidatus Aquilonibacter sp.]
MPSELLTSERDAWLERYRSTPTGREKPSRYWKVDLDALETALPSGTPGGDVSIEAPAGRIVAVDLATAQRDSATLLARAFGKAVVPAMKFAHLARAFTRVGAFVYIPADYASDEPVVIRYRSSGAESIFPHTVVYAERGSRATVVEHLDVEPGSFVCGIAEIVTEEGADVTFAAPQRVPGDARVLYTRAALPGKDARITWATAELGAALAVADIAISAEHPGVDANIATLFFPSASQHVDIVSTVDHRVGDTTSETIVKAAATGAGQGRYLGNIRIAAHAQHTQASLKDDALLLSKRAHIDSIPALEIAANDVKAFHGATVGALDDDAIFYMTSRGIDRAHAERMIALGFFEPVVERFPGETLRDELRAELQRKIEP